MRPPVLHLLCDTNPMCYGSSTAALSILDALRAACGQDVRLVGLVEGVTAEVLGADPVFDETLETCLKEPDAVRHTLNGRHVDAALVVSNRSNVDLYLSLGIPVFFVDVLYWFGASKSGSAWTASEGAFAQRFPGVEARAAAATPPPTVVGPLIRDVAPSEGPREGTLVAIGGAKSRWVRPGDNSAYASRVADWIIGQNNLPAPITFAGGRDAIASIPQEHPIWQRATLVTLSNPDYLNLLASSALVVTAPGLNAVFEALYTETPFLLLPPQNATQVAQLVHYESAGLCAPGLNLDQLDAAFAKDALHSGEAALTEAVLAALARLDSPDVCKSVSAHLQRQLSELEQRAPARAAFREELGEPGGRMIADAVMAWWSRLWM